MQVNEEGTVAAAVTALRMVLESASYKTEKLELILDHPYAIVYTTTTEYCNKCSITVHIYSFRSIRI